VVVAGGGAGARRVGPRAGQVPAAGGVAQMLLEALVGHGLRV
jgi:hypothetical protein